MNFKIQTLICIIMLSISFNLFAQTRTSYIPLEVGKYWTKRVVTEDDNNHTRKRYFYRPIRFESLELICADTNVIQIRAMLTSNSKSLDFSLIIDGNETKYSQNISHSDNNFFYIEPVNIKIPKNVNSIYVKTRNPNAYFRHYEVKNIILKPITSLIEPFTYNNKYILKSPDSSSEYFSSSSNKLLTYEILEDGDIYFFVRTIVTNTSGATIDIFKNNEINQTIVLSNSQSKDYRLANNKVTIGRRIEIKNLKKGDTLTIAPKTNHEVIVRMFLTTQPK